MLARTGVFLVAALGKIGTGLFAKPFSATEAAKIGFAMSAWVSLRLSSLRHLEAAHETRGILRRRLAVLLAPRTPFAVKFAIDVDRETSSTG